MIHNGLQVQLLILHATTQQIISEWAKKVVNKPQFQPSRQKFKNVEASRLIILTNVKLITLKIHRYNRP
jgi:hypothetical protein